MTAQRHRGPVALGNLSPATSLAYQLDWVLFVRDVLGIELDEWQAALLRHPDRSSILATSRQVGKSTAATILAAVMMLMRPGAQVLVASTGQSHASHLLRLIREYLLQFKARDFVTIRTDSAHRIALDNGSGLLVIAANPASARGYSPSLLLVDEAAFIAEAPGGNGHLIDSLLPSISASGGAAVLMSTPNGCSGRFYDIWTATDNDYWHRVEVPWHECSRLDPKLIESLRKSMPPATFNQEYLVSFLSRTNAFFSEHTIDQLRGGSSSEDIISSPNPDDEVVVNSRPAFGSNGLNRRRAH